MNQIKILVNFQHSHALIISTIKLKSNNFPAKISRKTAKSTFFIKLNYFQNALNFTNLLYIDETQQEQQIRRLQQSSSMFSRREA